VERLEGSIILLMRDRIRSGYTFIAVAIVAAGPGRLFSGTLTKQVVVLSSQLATAATEQKA
jgi:hypothetical protein